MSACGVRSCLPALNTDPPEGSAALAAALMRETLGAGGRACHPLVAARGLSRTFIDPALAFLIARDGARSAWATDCAKFVLRRARAVALEFEAVP